MKPSDDNSQKPMMKRKKHYVCILLAIASLVAAYLLLVPGRDDLEDYYSGSVPVVPEIISKIRDYIPERIYRAIEARYTQPAAIDIDNGKGPIEKLLRSFQYRDMPQLKILEFKDVDLLVDGHVALPAAPHVPMLKYLKFKNTDIHDADLAALRGYPIEGLWFYGNRNLTSRLFEHVESIDRIKNIHIDSEPIDAGTLRSLVKFEKLDLLSLHNCQADSIDMANLPANLHFHAVYIDGKNACAVHLTNAVVHTWSVSFIGSKLDLSKFDAACLKDVERITVCEGKISPFFLESLTKVPGLKELKLRNVGLVDDDGKYLSRIPKLDELIITGNKQLTIKIFDHFADSDTLRAVDLHTTNIVFDKKLADALEKLKSLNVVYTDTIAEEMDKNALEKMRYKVITDNYDTDL